MANRIEVDVKLMRASSGVSLLASLLLLLLLHKLRTFPKANSSIVNSIMIIIAATNLMLSASIFIGQPRDGTFWCWVQAVTTNYFCLVHIFWTTMLAYTLLRATKALSSTDVFSKLFLVLGFGAPMVVTLLPLTTNTYGNPDADRGWCFLDDRGDSPDWTLQFWIWFSFYFWILAAVIMSIAFLLVSFSVLSVNIINAGRAAEGPTKKRFASAIFLEDDFSVLMMKSIFKIIGYPIIILICWGPSLLYDTTESSGSNRVVDFCNFFFPGLQGTLVALVFVATNREAKTFVNDFGIQLRKLSTNGGTDNVKFDEDCYDADEPDFVTNASDCRRSIEAQSSIRMTTISNPIANHA